MRPSAPRPQTFGAMRPASQVPRMMSTQRVGQSLILEQYSNCTANTVQLYGCYLSLCVDVLIPLLDSSCSNSIHGAPTSHRSCWSSRSCAGSPSVQICRRSPQHPATYDSSATSHHAAGRVHISLTHSGFHGRKLNLDVYSKFSVLLLIIPCTLPPPQPAVHVQGQEPLTASMLAAAPPQEQKQMLGKCQQQLFMTAYHVGLTAFIPCLSLDPV